MNRTLIISLIFVTMFTFNVNAGMVIIVNKNNPVTNISSSQLKHIYNGNFKFWDGGIKIIPVDHPETDPMAISFTTTILGVDMETRRMEQVQRIYAGIAASAHQETNCASVVSFVSSEPGAIGYIKKESITSAVKIITVEGTEEF